MEVTLALLADAANISREGKLNVLGSFNNINATEFPCAHPQMVLVTRFDASRAEIGQTKQLEIRLIDPDGKTLGTLSATFEVPDGPVGQRVSMDNILPLVNTAFERAGDHSFAILINGETKDEVRLKITDSTSTTEEHNDDDNA
jgi:hypothetical protein